MLSLLHPTGYALPRFFDLRSSKGNQQCGAARPEAPDLPILFLTPSSLGFLPSPHIWVVMGAWTVTGSKADEPLTSDRYCRHCTGQVIPDTFLENFHSHNKVTGKYIASSLMKSNFTSFLSRRRHWPFLISLSQSVDSYFLYAVALAHPRQFDIVHRAPCPVPVHSSGLV